MTQVYEEMILEPDAEMSIVNTNGNYNATSATIVRSDAGDSAMKNENNKEGLQDFHDK